MLTEASVAWCVQRNEPNRLTDGTNKEIGEDNIPLSPGYLHSLLT